MVLTFTDWNNYTDETGAARSIDWANLEGCPRAAAAEAIRQAIVERFDAISTDAAAEVANLFGTYFYGEAMAAMVLAPIPEGVDLDMHWRLRAFHESIAKLLQIYGVHEPTVASMAAAYSTPYATAWPFADGDVFSAGWAREARAALDRCHAILLQPGATTGTPTIGYAPSLVLHPRAMASRDVWHIEAPAGTYPTAADLAAALAAQPWQQSPGGYAYGSLLFRYTGVWASPTTTYAYRQRSVWTFPALPCARRVDYLRTQTGTLPESAHASQESVIVGPDAGALAYSEGDSKALADPPAATFPSLVQGHAWGSAAPVFVDFAVPGGFTFQETP